MVNIKRLKFAETIPNHPRRKLISNDIYSQLRFTVSRIITQKEVEDLFNIFSELQQKWDSDRKFLEVAIHIHQIFDLINENDDLKDLYIWQLQENLGWDQESILEYYRRYNEALMQAWEDFEKQRQESLSQIWIAV